jgi:hypothetical protein
VSISPSVPKYRMRKRRNRADDESKAPVKRARISPEWAGKQLESWKEEMNTKGPPSARKR